MHGTISMVTLPRIRYPGRLPFQKPSHARSEHFSDMVERPLVASRRPRHLASRHPHRTRTHSREARNAATSPDSMLSRAPPGHTQIQLLHYTSARCGMDTTCPNVTFPPQIPQVLTWD